MWSNECWFRFCTPHPTPTPTSKPPQSVVNHVDVLIQEYSLQQSSCCAGNTGTSRGVIGSLRGPITRRPQPRCAIQSQSLNSVWTTVELQPHASATQAALLSDRLELKKRRKKKSCKETSGYISLPLLVSFPVWAGFIKGFLRSILLELQN